MVTAPLHWPAAHRIVPNPDAPVAAFDMLVDGPNELAALLAVEAITNPLAREAAGNLPSVPVERHYRGPLASLVMLPFVLPRESRFSSGFFGVLYAADVVDTALDEAAHHAALRFRATNAQPGTPHRLYGFTLDVQADLVDARRGGEAVDDAIYDPDSYAASQRFGRALRDQGYLGVHYTSIRRPSGTCIGLFSPHVVRRASKASRWLLLWDGSAFAQRAEERRPR
jgi:hypothetical protein